MNEKDMRKYLLDFAKYYTFARAKINMPVDGEYLSELIKSMQIEILDMKNTTGTFKVDQSENKFSVIRDNFKKSDVSRINFLLFHEMTHLSSSLNKNLRRSQNIVMEKYQKYKIDNADMSGFDVACGLIAIDEVMAQYCAEKCNDTMSGKKSRLKDEMHVILGNEVKARTHFSDKDIYAPLEQYVEALAKRMGYKSLKSFCNDILTGKKDICDLITRDNIEELGYIGIICEGIYQENGFNDFGLPATDIPKAVKFLESRRKKPGLPGSPDER